MSVSIQKAQTQLKRSSFCRDRAVSVGLSTFRPPYIWGGGNYMKKIRLFVYSLSLIPAAGRRSIFERDIGQILTVTEK